MKGNRFSPMTSGLRPTKEAQSLPFVITKYGSSAREASVRVGETKEGRVTGLGLLGEGPKADAGVALELAHGLEDDLPLLPQPLRAERGASI